MADRRRLARLPHAYRPVAPSGFGLRGKLCSASSTSIPKYLTVLSIPCLAGRRPISLRHHRPLTGLSPRGKVGSAWDASGCGIDPRQISG